MVQKTSAKKLLGAVAILGLGLVSLTGCSNLGVSASPSPSHKAIVVHASASPSPAAESATVAAVLGASLAGDYLQTAVDGKAQVISQIAHSTKAIDGFNFVIFEAAAKKYLKAKAADAAAFAVAHPTVLTDAVAQLNGGKCTRIITTKGGYLAVCGANRFDIAVKSGKVVRIYKTVVNASGKSSRTQFLISTGSSPAITALFKAATAK
jgi:hypothetical protein